MVASRVISKCDEFITSRSEGGVYMLGDVRGLWCWVPAGVKGWTLETVHYYKGPNIIS